MRVSSQAMTSTPARVSSARRVMSPRLPIGVATRCSPGAAFGAVKTWEPTENVLSAEPAACSDPYMDGAFARIGPIYKRFRAKWMPVRVKKTRQTKKLGQSASATAAGDTGKGEERGATRGATTGGRAVRI